MSSCLPFFFTHRVLKRGTLESFIGKIPCMMKAAYSKPTHLPKHLYGKRNKKVTTRRFKEPSAEIYLMWTKSGPSKTWFSVKNSCRIFVSNSLDDVSSFIFFTNSSISSPSIDSTSNFLSFLCKMFRIYSFASHNSYPGSISTPFSLHSHPSLIPFGGIRSQSRHDGSFYMDVFQCFSSLSFLYLLGRLLTFIHLPKRKNGHTQ